ncbi:hypothetical protein EJF36_19510 [Bacillus sp. HMF5848]|uniref:hypothetical protein n=1 Tax=Bacillus sp. HMF5848 TaxID=2495421 RepID=UPI000F7BACDF|nr:hypothetical protein [Bacillus sp. HMF5848]RSK28887.1 hypothetical protein EJF36_19510 [Bacillus sp. HMF5848]
MLKNLPHGVKISISRSINQAFEQYMNDIKWSEDKFNLQNFMNEWRAYIESNASWFGKVDKELKSNPTFHEELAGKINECINKVLSEEPTSEQIEQLDRLIHETGAPDVSYSCKAEAKFYIDQFTIQLKKNSSDTK